MGMSGLAILLKQKGFDIVGIDRSSSGTIEYLRSLNLTVHVQEDFTELAPGDAIVLSDAIAIESSVAYRLAKDLGYPIYRRTQILQWVLSDKRIVAVVGSHGKSTTVGMLAKAMLSQRTDTSWFVGALPSSNMPAAGFRTGTYAIIELCEAYGGLSDVAAYGLVLTNIDHEHKDFYATYEELLDAFGAAVQMVPVDGFVVLPVGQEYDAIAERASCRVIRTDAKEWDQQAHRLRVPGLHNRGNAAAALAACAAMGLDIERSAKEISEFTGMKRRLELVFDDVTALGALSVYDDYAHHPTEISASLKALRELHIGRRLVVVFQPHLYSRTQDAYQDFASALDIADFIVLTEVYPAREDPIPGVSAVRIDELLTKNSVYVPALGSLPIVVANHIRKGDVVVFMGAGSIDGAVRPFLSEVQRFGIRKVLIAYGGDSPEREISIHSSLSAYEALKSRYDVARVDFSERLLADGNLAFLVGEARPDVVLLAVHGTRAEDGAIQGLLELAHIAYTGSGIQSSALCVDKAATKQVLALHGLPVARGFVLSRGDAIPPYEYPVVVKPNSQGSTVGMSFVEDADQLRGAIDKAFEFDDKVLVEEWLRGRELTVPIMGDRALPPIEIKPLTGQYDFANKYTPGLTEKICPAQVPDTVKDVALKAHQALKCQGLTRVDIILVDDTPYVLEINTLPGMTKTSLVSLSAKAAGIEFVDLLEWMLEDAYARWKSK